MNENIQQSFLSQVVDSKAGVTVYLTNGVKLQGCVVNYDHACILLARNEHAQLVYKHAISTILPDEAVALETAPAL